jgi:hypothetical protein
MNTDTMSSNTQVMRPGILVALKTSVDGGVRYYRRDLEHTEDGKSAKWETVREMEDPDEHRRAYEAARLAGGAIYRLCIRTNFGLLCPLEREEELDLAIAAARVAVDLWNSQAEHTWITVSAVKGRIADNDEDAVRAILSEATELVKRMDQGLAQADVKAIRDAASRAKRLAGILDSEASDAVTDAVAAARKQASEIVKRVGAEGMSAEQAVASVNREAFDKARFSFLDTAEAQLEALPTVDKQRLAEIEAYRVEKMTKDGES